MKQSHEAPINFKYRYVLQQYFLAELLLRMIKPQRVISVEGAWHIDRIFAAVASDNNIQSICIQRGWNPNINCAWKGLNFGEFLSWGEYFSNALKKDSPNVKFINLGTFHLTNNYDCSEKEGIGFFLQRPCYMISDEVWKDFLGLINEFCERFPDQKVYVRQHPTYLLGDDDLALLGTSKNLTLVNPYTVDLMSQISKLKIVVSIYSSCLVEAVVVKAIPVSYNKTAMLSYTPDLEKLGLGFEVKNRQSFFNKVNEILNNRLSEMSVVNSLESGAHGLFHSLGKESFALYEQHIYSDRK